ncbi:Lsr2 family DNA-binding protein [Streptomyces anulatus]|uniref:Lsr2 family DNA-binding protein n=1 Tax=Streptomyces anulatus TaxID=1892 RepID=UPI003446E998
MTIAALNRLLDEEQPDVVRHPAPEIPQITARKRKPMQQPRPVPGPPAPQETSSAGAAPLAVGKLLAWAEAHETRFVARKGAQARALLRELRGLYAEAEELVQVDAEEQRLLGQLAELRARKGRLHPSQKRKSPVRDYVPAEVRAWAKNAGLDVPAAGTVPNRIVAAWREATGGAR